MNQKDKNLTSKMKGEDVKSLQKSLRLLNFTIEDEEGYFGKTTHQAVVEFQNQHNLKPTGIVDSPTAAKINEAVNALPPKPDRDIDERSLVQGNLLQPDGTPVQGILIKAFDKDLRREHALGETKTDKAGKYTIYYTTSSLSRPGKLAADLIVRAYDQNKEVATSPLILNASPKEVVNLVMGNAAYRGPSEYTQVHTQLEPFLQDIKAADLTQEEVTYSAGKTGMDPIHVAFYAQSAKLEKESGIPAEVFYGLFRQNLPTDLPVLLVQDPRVLQHALEASMRDNIISSTFQKSIDTIMGTLQEQLIEHTLKKPELKGVTSFGDLLSTADLSEEQKRIFLQECLKHEGSRKVFWDRMSADPDLGGMVETLQFTLQLAALTQNYLPLIRALQDKQKRGEISSLRDLVDYDEDDWVTLIESVDVPPSVPGAKREEKISNYARAIMRALEDAFPTAVLAHRIRDDFPYAGDLKTFFENNRDFEFRSTRIGSYLKEQESVLGRTENEEVMKEQLGRMQRLFNIAPRHDKYDVIHTLTKDRLTSAHAICRMGKSAFMSEYGGQFGVQQAQQIYANARQTAAEALMLFAEYGPAMHNLGMHVLQIPGVLESGVPEWEELFGSLHLCKCEHCRSVYSPAAYLVDILHFLDGCVTNGRTALDVLFFHPLGDILLRPQSDTFIRRSDIGDIELTCKNTNTLMPYVDLVNEVLENAVMSLTSTGTVYQTEGTEEELRVYPEHLNAEAYRILAEEAFYPWILPFNLPVEEIRVYLGHLGVPRYELMKRFSKVDRSVEIASEHLRLTPRDREIIITDSSNLLEQFWNTTNLSDLETVSKFLEKSELCYEELQELLRTHFINPDHFTNPSSEMRVEFSEPTCDPDEARIVNLSENALDRIHRFVRLQRKLKLSIHELDAALWALPLFDLTKEFLINLSHVQHLHDTLKVPLITMLSWWANIDTNSCDDKPSLYESLFLSKVVTDIGGSVFELNGEKNELADTSHEIVDKYKLAVLTVLNIDENDLELLIEKLPNSTLNLANLSSLYRVISLAKALKLSISDFLLLRILTGINPFDPNDIAETIHFVEVVELVRASGFSIEELDYLLRHSYQPNSAVAPSEEQMALFLSELRSGLKKIAQEYSSTSDPTGEKTAGALDILLSEEEAEEAMTIVDHTSEKSVEEQERFVRYHFAVIVDPEDMIEKLVDPNTMIPVKKKEERFNYAAKVLLAYLQQENYVKRKMADALGLTIEASELLLTKLVSSRVGPAVSVKPRKAIADFSVWTFRESEKDILRYKEEFALQFCQFRLLDKIATITTQFDIPAKELTWLFQQGPSLGWLNLNSLPVEPVVSSKEFFDSWFEMAKMANLRDALPSGEPSLFELFRMLHGCTEEEYDNNDQENKFRIALSKCSGWSIADLEFLMGESGFGLTFPDSYQHEKALEQLMRFKRCFDMIRILGVSAEQVWNWNPCNICGNNDIVPCIDCCINFDQVQSIAQSIRQAVKAKYEEKQWLAVAKPLRDQLREQQRTALVAYLVHKPELGIEDADDLFSYFLIDVEMSPCMMTSRIKQAISSVQLFVQRCLMNLEPDVTLTPQNAKEWEWMKNYRVWEANRKVFLYPENWIEPELRDDKSPFFKDLENELLQKEVTMDSAEEAFKHYLEKLDEVKRLEISGMYRQREVEVSQWNGTNILHVFARTRDTPHVYYYRRWVDFYEYPRLGDETCWTPWERVDADIEGDHLIPVVYNRRLHLFWPVFRENAEEPSLTTDEEQKKPKKYYEIHMAWSEYRNGKWLAKRISNEFVKTPSCIDLVPKDRFRFYTFFYDDKDLVIPPDDKDKDLVIPPDDKDKDLVIAPEIWELSETGEVKTRHLKQFRFVGCDKQIEIGCYKFMQLKPILGTRSSFMKFVEENGSNKFTDKLELICCGENRSRIVSITCGDFVDDLSSPSNNMVVGTSCIDKTHLRSGLYRFEYLFSSAIDRILEKTPNTFSIDLFHQYRPFFTDDFPRICGSQIVISTYVPFFYEDCRRSFFVIYGDFRGKPRYLFKPFYHPYVCLLIKQLNRYGIDGLLDPDPHSEAQGLRRQMIEDEFFEDRYKPTCAVEEPYPKDEFDFSYSGAYSLYNWELFFHAPFLIADRLSGNQRFAEAQKWYHYIFDPTDVSLDSYPARFWKIKPFFNAVRGTPIQSLMLLLNVENPIPEEENARIDLISQIDQWRKNPFNPHIIARLRIVAYQKAIVMKYLDNLIAWGDHLFRRDTIESINEATQLYVLAAQILGKRPEDIPPPEGTKKIDDKEVKTFNDLREHLDEFSNALIQIETSLPPSTREYPEVFTDPFTYTRTTLQTSVLKGHLDTASRVSDTELLQALEQDYIPDDDVPISVVIGPTLFFCIPRNEKLLSYWDTVADRLFKIRYCMTIEGVVRQLPLFEPPIEPGLLVRAVAAGVDITSALSDLYAPLPYYRFQVMLQKAIELCSDVKSLGAALLAALEKRDAEELALLHSTHEVNLLKAVRQVREQQIKEAEQSIEALQKSRETAEKRKEYYESREYTNEKERLHLDKLELAQRWQVASQGLGLAAGAMALIPELDIGVSGAMGSPVVKARYGGSNISTALQFGSQVLSLIASVQSYEANRASIIGSWDRRQDDWNFQAEQAEKEIEQIEKQIAAAEIRLAIAEQELENHDLQTENAKEVDEYMRTKFTNQQLYNWMVSQLSTLYFQSYQMAYDLAKRAEKTFQYEIGDQDAAFIKFGYWDSLKKGLLAGEWLHYDLRRMEIAYCDQNKREYEITKHISLAILDPGALVELKETGECHFNLPEVIFDLDCPGHYMRRIKSVSLTIPCVTGPYTSVSCTLTLGSNRIRTSTEDDSYIDNVGGIESIVTSSAREDSGLFELNFHDERYLPFEGAGVISSWRIELPTGFRQFDYDTISDVVIHVRYTAREGGENFKDKVEESLETALEKMLLSEGRSGLFRLFSAKQEFPDEWHQFLHPNTGENNQMTLNLEEKLFPFLFKDRNIQIDELTFFIKLKDRIGLGLSVKLAEGGSITLSLVSNSEPGGLPSASLSGSWNLNAETQEVKWTIKVTEESIKNLPDKLKVTEPDGTSHLNPDAFEDLGILCHYSI